MNEFAKRKRMRLKGYDYAQNGAYFATLCTHHMKQLFWYEGNLGVQPELSSHGRIVEDAIKSISQHYPYVAVDKYVIMPNRVHMIIFILSKMTG